VLVVGVGLTEITVSQQVELHTLLGMLNVEDPEADVLNPSAWSVDGSHSGLDTHDMAGQDEQIRTISAADGFEIVPRWITINGERGFVVRGPGFAAVGLTEPDSDWDRLDITRELLSWGFSGQSCGPCIFEGHSDLGWCGSRLWVVQSEGDLDREALVLPAPDEADLPDELAGWILRLEWEAPYLFSAVGPTGLTGEDRNTLWETQDVEGDFVSSALGEALDSEVIERLCARVPELQAAAEGLREPQSERGQLIYAWLGQIIHRTYPFGSWSEVHAAMLGLIDPPTDDRRAPSVEERVVTKLRWAESAMLQETPARGTSIPQNDGFHLGGVPAKQPRCPLSAGHVYRRIVTWRAALTMAGQSGCCLKRPRQNCADSRSTPIRRARSMSSSVCATSSAVPPGNPT